MRILPTCGHPGGLLHAHESYLVVMGWLDRLEDIHVTAHSVTVLKSSCDDEADHLEVEVRRTANFFLNLDKFAERCRASDSADERLELLDATLLALRRRLGDLLAEAAR